jgi:hypothetical protein
VGRYSYLGGADPEEIKRAVWRNLLSREEQYGLVPDYTSKAACE